MEASVTGIIILILLLAALAIFFVRFPKELTLRDFIEHHLMMSKAPAWIWWLLFIMIVIH
jgi:hypothetical protein